MAAIIDMLFQQEVETEKMRKNTRSLVILVSLILTLCSLVMSGMNLLNESWFMLGTTLALAASCFICFLIGLLRYNRMAVECILCVSIISLFSLYVIIGGNAGFAIDWILLVPIAYTALFGLTAGILMGGYFWVFLILCMWTPVHALLPYVYADEVRLRFPILYTCGFFMAIFIGVRSKKLKIAQTQYEQQLSEAVMTERSRAEQTTLDAISSICHALDAKDTYTKEHSDHVARYACLIARRCGWNDHRLEQLERAAKVHDLGKIGIPDVILKKEGPLSPAEFEVMKQHVALGADIVSEFILMPELAVGAKYHHERYDGKGYIYGISAEEIPIEGRIIGLADAIDAMSSDRVYRGRLSREIMLTELKKGAGKQFDPHLVEIALELIQEGMLE